MPTEPAAAPAKEAKTGAAAEEEDDPMAVKWKVGDRVYAVWAGNGCYYAASVVEVFPNRTLMVDWDDKADTHRTIKFDQVMEPSEDSVAWTAAKINRRVIVKDTETKGRCLFVNEACEPGQVVFVEKPVQVALPALEQKLWNAMQKLHEATPLNLGTITFHFAALMSQLLLDDESNNIILDKFVPEPDEDAGEDVSRILKMIEDDLKDVWNLKEKPVDGKRLQRLVSAWRYNSFGHHKEDGLVLYNRISMCAHSCDPTCCWSYGDDDAFVLRARVALKAGDELTISYLQDQDLLSSTAVRQTKLQNWRFTCGCPRCSLKIDVGRGFRCRRCRVGILFASADNGLEPCGVCNASPSQEDTQTLLHLEEDYVTRVENLDKTDTVDIETVYQAAIDIFDRHWILYVMDTMLWDAYREKRLVDAMEHQRRRIDFHEHYYCRPTFILAWCREELGDSLQTQSPHRKWHYIQEFQRAYHMLAILCGYNHQYTASPYNKLWSASSADNKNTTNNATSDTGSAAAAGTGTTASATP